MKSVANYIYYVDAIDGPITMQRGGQNFHYIYDERGSVIALTNDAGQVVQRYEYDSFGRITQTQGTVANPFTYTAREYDPETGLYFLRARAYDPDTGRFLQQDPINDTNLYAYALNNPVNFTDPLGLKVRIEGPINGGFFDFYKISGTESKDHGEMRKLIIEEKFCTKHGYSHDDPRCHCNTMGMAGLSGCNYDTNIFPDAVYCGSCTIMHGLDLLFGEPGPDESTNDANHPSGHDPDDPTFGGTGGGAAGGAGGSGNGDTGPGGPAGYSDTPDLPLTDTASSPSQDTFNRPDRNPSCGPPAGIAKQVKTWLSFKNIDIDYCDIPVQYSYNEKEDYIAWYHDKSRTIYYNMNENENLFGIAMASTYIHEYVHADQHQKIGNYYRYYYLYEDLIHGYDRNKYEIQARDVADGYMSCINSPKCSSEVFGDIYFEGSDFGKRY